MEPPDIDRLTAVLSRVRTVSSSARYAETFRCRALPSAVTLAATVHWCVVEGAQGRPGPSSARGNSAGATTSSAAHWIHCPAWDLISYEFGSCSTGSANVGRWDIAEVIIATDPNTEGEATATYLVRILRYPRPDRQPDRLGSARMGGDLEFADELTLGRALSGRRAMV